MYSSLTNIVRVLKNTPNDKHEQNGKGIILNMYLIKELVKK